MALGPGKYDDLCTYVREKANAEAAIVIVMSEANGPGFSCQGSPSALASMCDVLEVAIQNIRASMKQDLQNIQNFHTADHAKETH